MKQKVCEINKLYIQYSENLVALIECIILFCSCSIPEIFRESFNLLYTNTELLNSESTDFINQSYNYLALELIFSKLSFLILDCTDEKQTLAIKCFFQIKEKLDLKIAEVIWSNIIVRDITPSIKKLQMKSINLLYNKEQH